MANQSDPLRIHLSLVSHTNIGKTTLARTLLSRDVGEVADRAHVTLEASSYVLARNSEGCELLLWDTPGFGNSLSLAKRLEGRSNPVGWFISEIWDRVTNKSFWLDQQAMRHIKDTSSVVLYLVNAAEPPETAAYVEAEMRILTWIGKPVIVLLNQMGQPRPPEQEAADIKQWQKAMESHSIVSDVISLDAFARCWVQEFVLFDAIAKVLDEEQSVAFEALREIWARQRRGMYSSSVQALMRYIDKMAHDKEMAENRSMKELLFSFGRRFGLFRDESSDDDPTVAAQTALSARATDSFCALTDELLAINGLKGQGVKKEILSRMQSSSWDVRDQISPGQAAVAGAVSTGAFGGLAADLATGGLSLGIGTLIGTIVGALGGAGLAVGYNQTKAPDGTSVSWSDEAVKNFCIDAILLYLALAHFGRGRGNWAESEYPEFWKDVVVKSDKDVHAERDYMANSMDAMLRNVLTRLYPKASF
jgi:GTPase Era involved in 16S rRNA processing